MANHKLLRFAGITLALVISTSFFWASGELCPTGLSGTQPVLAQSRRIRADDVWQQIYQRLPNLPLENQYVSKETGKVATDNTLIGRLIRYHLYVKGRPPFYRLDWKLTLADYLGVNEPIEESTYPGQSSFRSSPVEADIAAIRRLNRAQRDALVQALVDAFTPQAPRAAQPMPSPGSPASTTPSTPSSASATPKPAPQPSPAPRPARGPGAAELLQ